MARTKPSTGVTTRRSSQPNTRAHAASFAPIPTTSSVRQSTKGTAATTRATKQAPRRKSAQKKSAQARKPVDWKRVRVWWPPTKDKRKTDFGGAYWPAKVTDRYEGGFRVEYDNGDREDVGAENVSPAAVPVDFGQEATRLQVKEYCEVFNNSQTDPAAWLARILKVGRGCYTIEFPFHDSMPEVIKEERIRRARVYDEETSQWKVIQPMQDWDEGEVTSPLELELIKEEDLPKAIKAETKKKESVRTRPKVARKSATPWPSKPKEEKGEKAEAKGDKKQKKRKADKAAAGESKKGSPQGFGSGVPMPAPIALPPQVPISQSSSMAIPAVPSSVGAQVLQFPPNLVVMQPIPGVGGGPGLASLMMVPPLASEKSGSEGTEKKPKKRKDPNAPKKPKTAYVFFMERQREVIKREHPEFGSSEAMKMIGEMWSQVTPEMREECEKKAEEDRERYKREMQSYVPPPEELLEEKGRGRKRRKMDREGPKKPLSSYLLFSKDYREKLGGAFPFAEATEKTAEAWRNLEEEEKDKYEKLAEVERKKYEKEKEAYDAKIAQELKERQQQQQAALLQSLSALTSTSLPFSVPQPPLMSATPSPPPVDPEVKQMLSQLDLNKARQAILRLFTQEAYYLLLDVWREGSDRLGDAIRAYNAHISGRERRNDWRAFFVSIFGVGKMTSMLKPEKGDKGDKGDKSEKVEKDAGEKAAKETPGSSEAEEKLEEDKEGDAKADQAMEEDEKEGQGKEGASEDEKTGDEPVAE